VDIVDFIKSSTIVAIHFEDDSTPGTLFLNKCVSYDESSYEDSYDVDKLAIIESFFESILINYDEHIEYYSLAEYDIFRITMVNQEEIINLYLHVNQVEGSSIQLMRSSGKSYAIEYIDMDLLYEIKKIIPRRKDESILYDTLNCIY
jgi:hypothetical protein